MAVFGRTNKGPPMQGTSADSRGGTETVERDKNTAKYSYSIPISIKNYRKILLKLIKCLEFSKLNPPPAGQSSKKILFSPQGLNPPLG